MTKQETEITIDFVGGRGDGVGAWNGKPVFVPRALPGERVRVRIGPERDKGHAGRLLEIIETSPERAAPRCPHYESCGGCALQHWNDQSYRNWKETRVRGLLQKAGVEVRTWLPSVFVPPHTRRRATLAALLKDKKLFLGFHGARSHDIADTPDCLVLTPRLLNLAAAMRPYLPNILTDGKPADIFMQDVGAALDVMVTGLIGSRREPQMKQREALAAMAHACGIARLSWRFRENDEPEIMAQNAPVMKRSGGLSVELPPGAFLQPSAEGENALTAAVAAPLAAKMKIADLYAGCGTFAGPLLNHGTVYAVEGDASAVAALTKAARRINAPLTAERRNLMDNPLTEKELNKFDAVIFDPPRSGAATQTGKLAISKVPLAVGISCNPATFARDAKTLCDGGYALQSVQIIDQFTWSAHTELAAVFRKE